MRKSVTHTFLAFILFPLSLSWAQGQSPQVPKISQEDFILVQDAIDDAVNAINSQRKCEENSNKLLLLTTRKPSTTFVAAKLAWLQGKPWRAIEILDKVRQTPNGYTDSFTGLPADLLAMFWMTTIYRQCGDFAHAIALMDDMSNKLENDPVLVSVVAVCFLYQAEIAGTNPEKMQQALKGLERLKNFKLPDDQDQGRLGMELLKDWNEYQKISQTKGRDEAAKGLKGSKFKLESAAMVVMGHLYMTGILSEVQAGRYDKEEDNLFLEESLKVAIRCGNSQIDRNLSLYHLGFLNEKAGKYTEAQNYYRLAFDADFFFAPEAGIALARCLRNSQKTDEAEAVIKEVGGRFPGYIEFLANLPDKY